MTHNLCMWNKERGIKHTLCYTSFKILQLTPGTKVKMLYFWFLMAFLGYFSSHFSGQPNHTVLAFSSFFLRHMWARQSQQLRGEHIHMIHIMQTSCEHMKTAANIVFNQSSKYCPHQKHEILTIKLFQLFSTKSSGSKYFRS